MGIGLIIIGDEILSGKRSDRHFPAVIDILKKRGMQLNWVEYLGDDPAKITATLSRTFVAGEMVFSCGGIGARLSQVRWFFPVAGSEAHLMTIQGNVLLWP